MRGESMVRKLWQYLVRGLTTIDETPTKFQKWDSAFRVKSRWARAQKLSQFGWKMCSSREFFSHSCTILPDNTTQSWERRAMLSWWRFRLLIAKRITSWVLYASPSPRHGVPSPLSVDIRGKRTNDFLPTVDLCIPISMASYHVRFSSPL